MVVGMCKWIAQSQAMLDSLFLSVADIVLLTADADVGEMVPMPMERLSFFFFFLFHHFIT
jgi:hypothetical protein